MTGYRSSADLGGLDFGPVVAERNEPVFHDDWERRAMALVVALGPTGQWTLDHSRSARESLPREQYLASSYYQIWIDAVLVLLAERGLVTQEEIAQARPLAPGRRSIHPLTADRVDAVLAAGSPTRRPSDKQPRFAVGDAVITRASMPVNHTRLPTYARGKRGTITALHGTHVFPDRHASRMSAPFDEEPEWLYTVAFDARELWEGAAEPSVTVSIDAFEPYLNPVDRRA